MSQISDRRRAKIGIVSSAMYEWCGHRITCGEMLRRADLTDLRANEIIYRVRQQSGQTLPEIEWIVESVLATDSELLEAAAARRAEIKASI